MPDPYINQKLDSMKEKGSPKMVEENGDGWVEVQRINQQSMFQSSLIQRGNKGVKWTRNSNTFWKFSKSWLSRSNLPISFTETLVQMSNYVKSSKQILSKKKKLKEFKIVAFNKEYSVVALNKECNVVLQSNYIQSWRIKENSSIPTPLDQNFHVRPFVI